jgi:methanogenic corrinoid protein MtbC1
MADVRKALGIDEKAKVTDTIAEMQQTIRKQELDTELRNRIKAPEARKFIKSMVVSEMKSDESVVDTIERVLKTTTQKLLSVVSQGRQFLARTMTASGALQPASLLT